MLDIIKNYLDKKEWRYSKLEKANVLVFGIGGKNGSFQCIAQLIEEHYQFLFLSICGSNTPSNKRNDMLILLNHINHGLITGNFEMDNNDGEVRFRTSIDYENILLNEDVVEQLIMSNIISMDKNLPFLMSVMYGGNTVEEAIETINNQEEVNSED